MARLGDETFLTVAEVAAVLKLNQQTVRNWIDGGRLPALRIGRRVRVTRSDLDRFVDVAYAPRAGANGHVGYTAREFWAGDQHPGPS